MSDRNYRHILSLSGGKDSTALAIYMHDKLPDLEYVFCDTGKELPETYNYLERIEAFLGKRITVLKDDYGFDHWLQIFGDYLPSPRMRWCTKYLKLHPFERYIGDSKVISYIGLRADEDRTGYISTKPGIRPLYPFKDDGLYYDDIVQILEDSGIGLPPYKEWRSRSGCYFCFFQQKIEWVGLLENHPDLFWLANDYEKVGDIANRRFTWCGNESLKELARPERVSAIKEGYEKRKSKQSIRNDRLIDVFESQDDVGPQPCLICTL